MKWILLAASAIAIGSCAPKHDDLIAGTPATDAIPSKPADSTATATSGPASPVETMAPRSVAGLPAGDYTIDPAHSTLLFRVSHLGFSNFTGWFDTFSANLKLDPANPSGATLTATVNPASLTIHAPPKGFADELRGDKYLDAKKFPQITFKSTSVTMKGDHMADVAGELTLHGVTKPITLEMTFNGGYAGNVYEPRARIGFSVHGAFKRADFDVGNGVPQPGSNMGVSDELEVIIEAEFSGPAWKDAPAANPPAKTN